MSALARRAPRGEAQVALHARAVLAHERRALAQPSTSARFGQSPLVVRQLRHLLWLTLVQFRIQSFDSLTRKGRSRALRGPRRVHRAPRGAPRALPLPPGGVRARTRRGSRTRAGRDPIAAEKNATGGKRERAKRPGRFSPRSGSGSSSRNGAAREARSRADPRAPSTGSASSSSGPSSRVHLRIDREHTLVCSRAGAGRTAATIIFA